MDEEAPVPKRRQWIRPRAGAKKITPQDSPPWTVPGGVAAVVALVGAILAAAGVVGDVLTRWVRHNPWQLTGVLAVALITAALVTVLRVKGVVVVLVTFALVADLIIGVRLATKTVAVRDKPHVALSTSMEADGTVDLAIKAGASSLSFTDDMLVQVIGLKQVGDMNVAMSPCREARGASSSVSQVRLETDDLLAWQQFGPDHQGNVAAEISTQISRASYTGICVSAVLRGNRGEEPDASTATAAYLQMSDLPQPPPPPPEEPQRLEVTVSGCCCMRG